MPSGGYRIFALSLALQRICVNTFERQHISRNVAENLFASRSPFRALKHRYFM
jgi:hypothetical protein